MHEDEGNHQEQVGELIKQTAASIDDLTLKMLFVTVQQNNLDVCIEYAVNKSDLHSSIVASTYLSISGTSSSVLQQWYKHFRLNYRVMTAQMNKERVDIPCGVLVRSLLL